MASKKISIKNTLLGSWGIFKHNWRFLVSVFIIVMVVTFIPDKLHVWANKNMPAIAFIFSLVGWLIQLVFGIGTLVIALKIVDGKKVSFDDLYKHYNLLLNYFLGSLLYYGVILAGFLLLIVPGVVWAIKYQYTTYLIVDKKMKVMDAFKKSGELTNGYKWSLFLLGLCFLGIMIVGLVAFWGLGLVVAWPVVLIGSVSVYKKLLNS